MARTKPLQDPEYRLFVERLTKAREAAGLSQIEAARRLGHTQSYVAKCEGLYRRIDVVELRDFLQLYGMSPDSFFRPWTREELRRMEAMPGKDAAR